MKNTRNILVGLLMIFAGTSVSSAQHIHGGDSAPAGMNMNNSYGMNMPSHTQTTTLKVWGKCEMCKSRIEKIALSSGAESADWNIKTKSLKVVFNPGLSSIDYISDKLAKAGHDTGLRSAKDKAYNALPGCCKYERIR